MIIAIQRRVSRALPIMLYSRRLTSTLELSSHVSHSLVTVATFKSASLIRSCTAETCFPLANKDVFFSFFVFSDISTVVQLCGLWEKMAAHPWACHAEQILLVSHPFPRLGALFFILLHSSSPKFCLLRNAETVACVLCDWASDIDGLEQGVWLTGGAAEILHILHRLIQSGRD